MAKRLRLCPFCLNGGITIQFTSGNEMRKHVAVRHPRSKAQKSADRSKLRDYRREVLLAMGRSRTR